MFTLGYCILGIGAGGLIAFLLGASQVAVLALVLPCTIILFGFGVVAAAVAAAKHNSSDSRLKREIRAYPLTRVSDCAGSGLVKLQGTLRYAAPPLTSPFTGRRCAYYLATVEAFHSAGKAPYWETLIREEKRTDFFVEDASGTALVRMNEANALVRKDVDSPAHLMVNHAIPEFEAFLARHEESSELGRTTRRLRYREAVLEEGEEVAVWGPGTHEPDPNPSVETDYRTSAHRLVMSHTEEVPLYVSDDPQALT